MPLFILSAIQGLVGLIALALPTILARLAVSFGVGVAAFTGLNLLLNSLKTLAFSNLTGISGVALQIIGLLNIDIAFSIVMSAYAMKLTIRTLGGAVMKTVGLK